MRQLNEFWSVGIVQDTVRKRYSRQIEWIKNKCKRLKTDEVVMVQKFEHVAVNPNAQKIDRRTSPNSIPTKRRTPINRARRVGIVSYLTFAKRSRNE